MRSYKSLYQTALEAEPDRLHFAAHSHHLWPDATREAQLRFWEDSVHLLDEKWSVRIFEEVLPESRRHLARVLEFSRPDHISLGTNTHELITRLASALSPSCGKTLQVLTTDSEFLSFARQLALWEESGAVKATRIPTEPFDTFPERFIETARKGSFDLIYVSHVFFNSGYTFHELETLATETPDRTEIVIDGYHAFAALPVSLKRLGERCFYIAGGYKYAQAGEGACFLTLPPRGMDLRPRNSGWFAGFGQLNLLQVNPQIPFPNDGFRFAGSTFDPSGWYRFNAVMKLWEYESIQVDAIHQRATTLAKRLLDGLEWSSWVKTGIELERQGNFLAFERADADAIHSKLLAKRVITDFRANRLRIGFGLYQDISDVDRLIDILKNL